MGRSPNALYETWWVDCSTGSVSWRLRRMLGWTPCAMMRVLHSDAGWSSPVARWAHNPKVAGSNPAPATKDTCKERSPDSGDLFVFLVMPHIGTRPFQVRIGVRVNE